ncbi:MAG: helix-turn-helix domain-containing protein [Pigmentiphaga sp.]|nr:helix-turn-helix domain-containing protein [Pigmentiphaga sp.]
MSQPLVKSAQRVVEVFEFFAGRRAPASLSQVAEALGYPVSSTFALLNTLRELGYLHYLPADRTFVPTVRAALLGIWVNDALMSDGTIMRLMYKLRDETGETTVLGVQSGHHVQYINVVKGMNYSSHRNVNTGALRPLLRSGAGRIILTLKSPQELRALVARINAEEPPSHHASLKTIMKELDECRRQGYAYTEGAATPGSGIIAVLLAAPAHQPPMVLGLGGKITRLREEREHLLAALQRVVVAHRAHMEALPASFYQSAQAWR